MHNTAASSSITAVPGPVRPATAETPGKPRVPSAAAASRSRLPPSPGSYTGSWDSGRLRDSPPASLPLDQDQEQQRQQGQHTDQHRRGRDGAEQFGLWVQRGGSCQRRRARQAPPPARASTGKAISFLMTTLLKLGECAFIIIPYPQRKCNTEGKIRRFFPSPFKVGILKAVQAPETIL